MDGLPVTIRLLDPPLHEFLPEGDLEHIVSELTVDTGMTEDEIYSRIEKLSEVDPMLGFRGCRLGTSYPELIEMQVRAIFQAAVSMSNRGVTVLPEIMVPLVGTPQELGHQIGVIRGVATKVFAEMGLSLKYKVGTMIEIPRAALIADEIAKEAEFFSFGTNDLTQMTFGYSRDDVVKFLLVYLSQGILQHDPFEVLDQKGVGQLIKMATEKGRAANPSLKVGICGEHGGEPSSVAFFDGAGLDYVSCSPFRIKMLQKFGEKVSRVWSKIRLRVHAWRIRTRKVMIKRFKKKGPIMIRGQNIGQTAPERIRVASFNVAMFSLAPAVAESDGNWVDGVRGHENGGPKSILKNSPMHSGMVVNESLAKRVSINLPENEISMAQNRILRSPICFPLIGWMEDGSRSILDVLREVDADVFALQDVKAEEEKGMKPLSDLAFALGMNYVFAESWAPEYGNAILSKWPIKRSKVQKIYDEQDFRNVLKATIDVPRTGEVNFYCTQLDHLDENWRMKQINAIIKSSDHPHVLAGGINSLSGSDYSFDRWANIVKYYEELGKPTPRTDVMSFLHENKYIDAKHFAGDCEPVVIISKGQSVQGTCKYGTRVDYILTSKGLQYQFVPGSYSVVSSKGTSDHHIVKVDLVKLKEGGHHDTRRTKKIKQNIVKLTCNCACCAYT